MFKLFKKKSKDEVIDVAISGVEEETKGTSDGIVVLKKTKPDTCGGTDVTLDTNAPNEIVSEEMILFDVTSALGRYQVSGSGMRNDYNEPLRYVSAFAVRAENGCFVFIESEPESAYRGERIRSAAVLKNDVFPALVGLVRESGIARKNGYNSTTHGLPENFGGSVTIKYASGEKISISDNQSPVITPETGSKIAELLYKALEGEKVELPDADRLSKIMYSEERKDGGFTRAEMSICPDGRAVNRKSSKYGDGKIYESEKQVTPETVAFIKKTITEKLIFAWSGLPHNGFLSENKRLTFVFDNGSELNVANGRTVPDQLSGGFFDIELEMTTKN